MTRICMPTSRKIDRRVFRGSLYEAQDVLASVDGVDLIALERADRPWLSDRWHQRLVFRDASHALVKANFTVRPVTLSRDYDVFIAVCQTYEDLLAINAVQNWKQRCRTSVCWVEEVWAASLAKYRHWLPALAQFDHVFVGLEGTVAPLSEALGHQCHWMPGAVDMLRFGPRSTDRPIDMYSVGRRWSGVHRELLKAADAGELWYVHDTFAAARADAYDHVEHREQFARLAQRSRYFLVSPAKMDAAQETRGQVEVGYRYFEGAAAGAVLVGSKPEVESFRMLFDWPDAVVEINPDGSDVVETLRRLDAQPGRVAEISARNAAESARRHDWVHRWHRLFDIAGVEPTPAMTARERRLEQMSRQASTVTRTRLAL